MKMIRMHKKQGDRCSNIQPGHLSFEVFSCRTQIYLASRSAIPICIICIFQQFYLNFSPNIKVIHFNNWSPISVLHFVWWQTRVPNYIGLVLGKLQEPKKLDWPSLCKKSWSLNKKINSQLKYSGKWYNFCWWRRNPNCSARGSRAFCFREELAG